MKQVETQNPKSAVNLKQENSERGTFLFRLTDVPILLAAAIFIFLLVNPIVVHAQDSVRQLSAAINWSAEQVRPAFVTIHVGDKNIKSGVFVDPDGYVLTSFRAVAGKNAVTVKVGGKLVPGKVVASDREGDLALIKLNGRNFPFAKLADSDSAQVGDWVITVGLTRGLSRNTMHGIISSSARRVASRDNVGTIALLQTTCAVDDSTLGAPLVNMGGEVIGIISYFPTKSAKNEWSQGLSHASPSGRARQLLEKTKRSPAVTPTPTSAPPKESLEIARQLSDAIRWIADQTKPAVVAIRGREITSGFIVDSRGYIVTRSEKMTKGESVKVAVGTEARPQRDGKVIATDPSSNLALVKIDGENFPVVRLGDSNKANIGEWVVAVGTPFGFTQSVVVGVVSFKDRKGSSGLSLLQVDVPFDRGGEGSPLLNAEGEVIGVCSSMMGGRTFAGNSFTIPINTLKSGLLRRIPK